MISRLEGWIMLQINCNHHLMSTCCQAFECFIEVNLKERAGIASIILDMV